MTTTAATRKHYEEAVVLGAVFSPAVLLTLPFAASAPHQVAQGIATALLLAVTAVGAIRFRSPAADRISLLHWKQILCWLLAAVLLTCSVTLALSIGRHSESLVAAALAAGLLAWAFLTGRLRRHVERTGPNPRLVGTAATAGAALAVPLLFLGGRGAIAALLVALQMLLAAVSALVALTTMSETRRQQQ